MLPVNTQLSILIHLANADHNVSIEELKIIRNTGQENGLNTTQIEALIASPKSVGDLYSLPKEEKLECLIDLIKLMKIDKKIYQKEIDFCERIALKLGYQPKVIMELSAYIYTSENIHTDRKLLEDIVDKYYIHED
jgi:uncharacterized tellurite resistance protein B-like protein|tara:strand:- start:837 stop:1244 length:408 start_codon:yes stop_codon:yes gene_type:complete